MLIRDQFVEQVLVKISEGLCWGRIGAGPIQHRDPEDSPAENSQDSDEIHEPLCGSQLGFFGSASGFEDFVEGLDLPSLRVPIKFLGSFLTRAHRQIGKQFPVDLLAIFRSISLAGVDRREDQFRIVFLLADGWADHHASTANFKYCSRQFPLLVPHLNTMQSPNWVSVIFRPPCPGVSEASSLTCGGYVAAWGLGWMLVSSWPRAILVGGGSGR